MAQQHQLPVIRDVRSIRTFRASLQGPVALIPTMGMLHEGHLSLVRLAAHQASSLIVSIYANPSQLTAPGEHQSYPSTLESDLDQLVALNKVLQEGRVGIIKAVFAPTDEEMYPVSPRDAIPRGVGSFVNILPLTNILEGEGRPSHFIGVATVCLKLFNAVQPDKAFFGEKDFQQTVVVKRLVRDFLLDIEVVVGETVRESDGLAMSSRNVFLGTRRRAVATILIRALNAAREMYEAGETDRDNLVAGCRRVIQEESFKQERLLEGQRVEFEAMYFDLAEKEGMTPINAVNPENGAVMCGAIIMLPLEILAPGEDGGRLGGSDTVRLIDSVLLEPQNIRS